MIIVAGGDSFVYGSELQSPNNTFSALISKNYDYRCVAWPGIGNDGISRRVINEVNKNLPNKIFVIVNWSFPGRYEFKFTYDTGQRTREWCAITPWTTKEIETVEKEFKTKKDDVVNDHIRSLNRAKHTGIYHFTETFYKHVGSSEYWEIYSSLKEIAYLQNYLTTMQVPYLFTCVDNRILYNLTASDPDENIKSLLDQIDDKNWFWFPSGTKSNETTNPRGFYQWAAENKYPFGTTHPLEQAHKDAAKLIQEKFNDMVKKHLE